VDGGLIEDITINNITMRDVTTSPLFIRLGSRMRGPKDIPIGAVRRINISNVIVSDAEAKFASIISGIPGHPIEDLRLSNIRIVFRGGGTKEDAAVEVPERENNYPEPSMFGAIPAYGFFVRHVKGLEMRDVEVSFAKDELRPAFVLDNVKGVDLRGLKAQRTTDMPMFVLKNVEDFSVQQTKGVPDTRLERVVEKKIL
jgi:polygalacturonase